MLFHEELLLNPGICLIKTTQKSTQSSSICHKLLIPGNQEIEFDLQS